MTQYEFDTIMEIIASGAPALSNRLCSSLNELVIERNELKAELDKIKNENDKEA